MIAKERSFAETKHDYKDLSGSAISSEITEEHTTSEAENQPGENFGSSEQVLALNESRSLYDCGEGRGEDESCQRPASCIAIESESVELLSKNNKEPLAEAETGLGLIWCSKSFAELHDYKAEHLQFSGKMVVLLDILRQCKTQHVKVLVFSQSVNALDKIQDFVRIQNSACSTPDEAISFLRLDGSIPQKERHSLVCRFNEAGGKETVFFISTKAGGVGLNLIAATRVVIFDTSWNPASDSQVCILRAKFDLAWTPIDYLCAVTKHPKSWSKSSMT